MPVPEKEKQIAYYESLLKKHGSSHRALDWNDPLSQERRFQALTQIRYFGEYVQTPSILDVGCGLGDLFGFLKTRSELIPDGFTYTGVDISPALITSARATSPAGQFDVVDIFERPPKRQFDYVVSVGALTIKTVVDRTLHDQYVIEMFEAMWMLAGRGVAVDFLSQWYLDSFQDQSWHAERYTYFRPEWVLAKVTSLTPRVLLRHDYDPAEFAIYLLR